ncbi:MAG: S-adenosylmethionine:tRNA ribosyltransferase-isomerase [Cytophagaceae bacterium]|jgi:S-adenosylmethionine:tRNA ribosyltransferase-isomerase|nr:S-adenosylmethionine:tRNA ribosyltransferase-isomerase [Cytophagaceae bacterium]
MHPSELSIRDYHYELPDEKIAKHPLPNRSDSKLLVYKQGSWKDHNFRELPDLLKADGSTLVFNNTSVLQARLLFITNDDEEIEIFCLEPHQELYEKALNASSPARWKCFVGRLKKWKEELLSRTFSGITLSAKRIESLGDSHLIEFSWNASISFSEVLALAGKTPIPPYLKRPSEAEDTQRYQTVFAKEEGSVAAPTAALHFTDELLETLQQQKNKLLFTTLHVGAGTFKPVKSDTMKDHPMHAEWMVIEKNFIEELLSSRHTIAVGTTSLRTLESIYWMGVKTNLHPECQVQDLEIQQWECYQLPKLQRSIALNSLLDWMRRNALNSFTIRTSILIAPGYSIQMVNALITNFHQPQSTLILLVAACIGEDWKKIYQHALESEYRFLSYGDSSLLYIS